MNRENLVKKLQNHLRVPWDIIVVGGGATGMGIALDAATRGYKTLLLEQSDFSKATSSRSTKLVHGGVRYLAQGDVLLVMEALHERGRMLRNAPHLTKDQEFVIPAYTIWDALLYTVGLKFYDLLAGRLSLGRSYYISKKKVLDRLPLIKQEGLKGGVVYHDGQFDDARMVISMAEACVENGGITLNYFKVQDLLKDSKNKLHGVRAQDTLSGTEYELNAKLVINATGVFSDDILRMDEPGSQPTIRPSQGVHLVLDKTFLQSDSAIMIPKTPDGRVLFAIPWYGKVVVGTTDTPLDDIDLEPVALEEEIRFILETAGEYLTRPPGKEDVLCIFAGLRPLVADPNNPQSTKEVSRRHKITISPSGLLSITGGKWTSYRRMAEETIDRGITKGLIEKRKCVTRKFSLYTGSTPPQNERLKIYGDRAHEIEQIIDERPGTGSRLHQELPYTRAEIIWICRKEMPINLDDILSRRTRALIINARASLDITPQVAEIMARELGFDLKWQAKQLKEYKQLVTSYVY